MRIFAIVAVLTLFGCKHTPITETIAVGAKETISGLYNSIPEECRNDTQEQKYHLAMEQVDLVVESCNVATDSLNREIVNRNLVILLLLVFLCILGGSRFFGGLLGKYLPTLGSQQNRHNQDN